MHSERTTVLPSTAAPDTPDRRLEDAYRACRRMQRRHDPTYFWATQRLPREVRPAVHALYGFVRGADELVDGPGRPSAPEERRRALDRWEEALLRGRERGRSSHPVIAALVDAGIRHQLPLDELSVYMDSMRVDCGPVRLRTREELDRYMRGSAGAVGLIMAPLLGAPAELHNSVARLGTAFQLTNFIRDVREDYELDRIYLPRAERDRFGVGEEDIAASRMTPGFGALLACEVARARELFAGTAGLTDVLSPSVGPAMRLARSVYQLILDQVETRGFDVLARTPRLSRRQVARVAFGSLVAPLMGAR